MDDFMARVLRLSKRLAAEEAETVLAITHGGVIRIMICLLLGLSPRHYLLFEVQPASLAILELHSAGAVLAGLNLGLD
jgi:broad specificity phosphatase PhoE